MLTRPSNNCTDTLQTYPLVREGDPQQENHKRLKIFSTEVKEKFGRMSQMVACYQNRLAD
jgi:hypothetical protein